MVESCNNRIKKNMSSVCIIFEVQPDNVMPKKPLAF